MREPAEKGTSSRPPAAFVMFVKASAVVFATLIAVSTFFQLALAAGAPWGHLAMGGRYPGPSKRRPIGAVCASFSLPVALGVMSNPSSRLGKR